jgi:hypothetical protein
VGTLDYGRDTTDEIVRQVGTDWWEAARAATPALLEPAVKKEAAKQGVDANYVLWSLVQDQKSWQRTSGAGMLSAVVRLYLESGNRSHESKRFEMPDSMGGERAVNKAIQNLVKWAADKFSDKMVDLFLSIANPAAEQIKAAMFKDHGERYTTGQARKVIFGELPLRVKDHSFWFRDPTTLRLMLQDILG